MITVGKNTRYCRELKFKAKPPTYFGNSISQKTPGCKSRGYGSRVFGKKGEKQGFCFDLPENIKTVGKWRHNTYGKKKKRKRPSP